MPGISSEALELVRLTDDRTPKQTFDDASDPTASPVVLLLAEIAVRLEHIERSLEEMKLGI